jgi:hypothetical protein
MNMEGSKVADTGDLEVHVHLFTDRGEKKIEVSGTNTGTLTPIDRRSAALFVKGLKPALEKPLKDFGKDISGGKSGGFSEKNREVLQKAKEMISNLKPNDFYTR